MGKPFGKASRRTFQRVSTQLPFPDWNSPAVTPFHSTKFPNQPPWEALEKGLPMPVYATGGFIHRREGTGKNRRPFGKIFGGGIYLKPVFPNSTSRKTLFGTFSI
jgi:hypothetical protein